MKATITSKGQITIPAKIRRKLNLKPGDVLEFDEDAGVLTAKPSIDPETWNNGWEQLRSLWQQAHREHPYEKMTSEEILEDMRGTVELPESHHDNRH